MYIYDATNLDGGLDGATTDMTVSIILIATGTTSTGSESGVQSLHDRLKAPQMSELN